MVASSCIYYSSDRCLMCVSIKLCPKPCKHSHCTQLWSHLLIIMLKIMPAKIYMVLGSVTDRCWIAARSLQWKCDAEEGRGVTITISIQFSLAIQFRSLQVLSACNADAILTKNGMPEAGWGTSVQSMFLVRGVWGHGPQVNWDLGSICSSVVKMNLEHWLCLPWSKHQKKNAVERVWVKIAPQR